MFLSIEQSHKTLGTIYCARDLTKEDLLLINKYLSRYGISIHITEPLQPGFYPDIVLTGRLVKHVWQAVERYLDSIRGT